VFCKNKSKKYNSTWKRARKNQRKLNKKQSKQNQNNQVEKIWKRKEDQKQDFFLGLFSSRASRKKTAYINTKNVQKNRKIFKNLLMYDKKNFLSLTQKKNLPKTKPPNKQLSKQRKRIIKKTTQSKQKILKFRLFFDFKNGKKKRIKTKIKSQDYETFFCLSKHFVSHLAYKNLCPNN